MNVTSQGLTNLFLSLERRVYDPDVRRSEELAAPLFAEDFVEYGGSGVIYDKAAIVRALAASPEMGGRVKLEDFTVKELGEGVALATYRLKVVDEKGTLLRQSIRSTIYRLTDGAWQQVFHQATKIGN